MAIPRLHDQALGSAKVLLRLDLNSPLAPSGAIANDRRLRSHLPTLQRLRPNPVVVLAHQSRLGKGDFVSLAPHAQRLQELLGPQRPVHFCDELVSHRAVAAIKTVGPGEVLLLENVRFWAEEVGLQGQSTERQAASVLVRTLAPLVQWYVNDAFGACHRGQVSLVGFTHVLPSAAGDLLSGELDAMQQFMDSARSPKVALLGGAKIDEVGEVMSNLARKGGVGTILTSGAIGNLLLMATGHQLGAPTETFLADQVDDLDAELAAARRLLGEIGPGRVQMPVDLATVRDGQRVELTLDDLPCGGPLLDIGPQTIEAYRGAVRSAEVLMVNGPAGKYEDPAAAVGTKALFAEVAAASRAFTLVGGGHTASAFEEWGLAGKVSHVSSGGGAMAAFLAGHPMPPLEALRASGEKFRSVVR